MRNPRLHLLVCSFFNVMAWGNCQFDERRSSAIFSTGHLSDQNHHHQPRCYLSLREKHTSTVKNVEATCWRFEGQVADFFHVWWHCPIIKNYWKLVSDTIGQILGMTLQFSPAVFSLHNFSGKG